MVKYVHIGYPKNFSTSLQRDYFSKNKEIFHLGIGLGDNLTYHDNVVNKAFELYLKTCKTFKYNQHKGELKSHLDSLYQQALQNHYKAFGLSSEHLSFAFTYDGLSADTKAMRLAEIFGTDVKIIMIIRSQSNLIKSLFRESIRVGFRGDFRAYVYYLYKYQDRNYISDLHYDWIYKTYCEIFGKKNIQILFFEDYRSKGQLILNENGRPRLFSDLDLILGTQSNNLDFGHYNEALSDSEVKAKINLNYSMAHDLGNHLYDSAEKHRLKNYLLVDLDLTEQDEVMFADVLTKRKIIKDIEKHHSSEKVNLYECDLEIWLKLMTEFKESNQIFENLLERKLPIEYWESNN